ncbi:4-hydroxybenzoate octaprenyltransferase [Thermaurantiacus sp.]
MTPDAVRSWVDWLPERAAIFARLARFDRPAGIWLLFWPCAMGAILARDLASLALLPWFLLGSAAMRGAGCIYNDIVDRDLDRRVARTAARPLASGAISLRAALALLVALALVGLLVLLQLPVRARLVALASLLLVAAYPFMKRITWWPQLWLGLTFNWGLLVGWACGASPAPPAVLLLAYAALVCWTLGYDSIYAAQDREDDALVGIRSSARALGRHLKAGVAAFLLLAVLLLGLAVFRLRPDPLILLGLLPALLQAGWQASTFDPDDPGNALERFRSNVRLGLLLTLALALTFPMPLGPALLR